MFKKILNTKTLFIIFILLATGFLYKSAFTAYFFQDDWFSFEISQVKNIKDILTFFIPRTDVIYYRPLGLQLPFFILRSIFGLNPTPYHILTFITHSLNIFLVFYLINKIINNKNLALISAFMYGTSAVNYIPFFWFSTYSFVLGPTFFFLTMILFINYIKNNHNKYYLLSFITYILGILINEMVVVTPLIIAVYLILNIKKKSYLWNLFIYFLFGGIVFIYRFVYYPLPSTDVYKLNLNKQIFSNLRGYLLWSFNLPEEMKAQSVSFFKFNPQFIQEFSKFYDIFALNIILITVLYISLPIIIILIKQNFEKLRIIFWGISWYLIGLSTVILFPDHSFSYYLPISLAGLLLVIVYLTSILLQIVIDKKFIYNIILLILIISWYTISLTTIEFNKNIHWAPRRAKISKELVKEVMTSKVLFINNYVPNYSEYKLALNDQVGFKIVFGDNIQTNYTPLPFMCFSPEQFISYN